MAFIGIGCMFGEGGGGVGGGVQYTNLIFSDRFCWFTICVT